MNDATREELKVLIENDGFITLDQILTILESIDFMYTGTAVRLKLLEIASNTAPSQPISAKMF